MTEDSTGTGDSIEVEGRREDLVDLVVAVVTVSAVYPFVQAIAAKAGEDVWAAISPLFRRGRRKAIEKQLAQADLLELKARDSSQSISIPTRVPVEQTNGLLDVVNSLKEFEGSFHVRFDATTRSWVVTRHE